MRVLVIRFSALGDIALSIPVIQQLKKQNPNVEITFVSREYLRPLFEPLGVSFIGADLNGKHKGIAGLWRLAQKIKKDFRPDLVIDIHSVMRSWILSSFFRPRARVFRIDKGRDEKKALTAREGKSLKQLTHSAVRYAETFRKAGLQLEFDIRRQPNLEYTGKKAELYWNEIKDRGPFIGIAAFAQHKGKSWPTENFARLLPKFSERGYSFLFFGGPDEVQKVDDLIGNLPNSFNIAGKFDLAGELFLMTKLKCMLAMDSSNMHLAVLAGVKVVSVWGATHPFAGFTPLGDNERYMVEVPVEDLSCRPCSVFGNKECWRGDYACLRDLGTEKVENSMLEALNNIEK